MMLKIVSTLAVLSLVAANVERDRFLASRIAEILASRRRIAPFATPLFTPSYGKSDYPVLIPINLLEDDDVMARFFCHKKWKPVHAEEEAPTKKPLYNNEYESGYEEIYEHHTTYKPHYEHPTTHSEHYEHPTTHKPHYEVTTTHNPHYGHPTTHSEHYEYPTTHKPHYEHPTTHSEHYEHPTTHSEHYEHPTTHDPHYEHPTTESNQYEHPTTHSEDYEHPTTQNTHYGTKPTQKPAPADKKPARPFWWSIFTTPKPSKRASAKPVREADELETIED